MKKLKKIVSFAIQWHSKAFLKSLFSHFCFILDLYLNLMEGEGARAQCQSHDFHTFDIFEKLWTWLGTLKVQRDSSNRPLLSILIRLFKNSPQILSALNISLNFRNSLTTQLNLNLMVIREAKKPELSNILGQIPTNQKKLHSVSQTYYITYTRPRSHFNFDAT